MMVTVWLVVALATMAERAYAQSARVPGFSPSDNAFVFVNVWPHQPDGVINVAGVSVPIGDAANGLCGGMVYAVRDYFQSGYHVPLTPFNPAFGTPLYKYIVQRLFDSLSPSMVTRLYGLQATPFDSDRQNTMRAEWPRIKAELDQGHLAPMQLVRVRADIAPWRLGQNHQVLAYGYDTEPDGTTVKISIYDPFHGATAGVFLTYSQASDSISQSTGEALYSFFLEDYAPAPPPPTQTWTNGFEGADAGAWWFAGQAGIDNEQSEAHRGSGVAWVEASSGWNAVNAWVPTLPGRSCTMRAYIWLSFRQWTNAYMTMRSAAPDMHILNEEHLTGVFDENGYRRYDQDFTADGWWGMFYVGLWGVGHDTWLLFDDVTVVCEAW
jgi:hypothetical protein